ncbi:helix-turn-helix transcriptional regulator [Candidatus Uhrbacteria bacterium]|nr:helix-turn-helix transcriptional regulator [Candidatus Uhrbacteria bacterium]
MARARGLSVNRLADFAGLSRGYVSRLLRAEQSPTLDTLEKLAAIEPPAVPGHAASIVGLSSFSACDIVKTTRK